MNPNEPMERVPDELRESFGVSPLWEAVKEISRSDAIVHAAMESFQHYNMSWSRATTWSTIELARQNARLMQLLRDHVSPSSLIPSP